MERTVPEPYLTDQHTCIDNQPYYLNYTFVSHNGPSVVDYLLCSNADSKFIKNFRILQFNEFSDHSPIMYCLASKYTPEESNYPKNANINDHLSQKIFMMKPKYPCSDNNCLTVKAY